MVRYPLMVLVEQGKLTQREAAEEMGLSVRQVRRVWKHYRQSGLSLESLAYQRRRPAPNALPNSVKEEIWRLHQEYPHWSCPAVAEALAVSEGAIVHRWVEDYNAGHVNRDTGCTPVERLEPSVTRTLADGADDIFCPPKAGA